MLFNYSHPTKCNNIETARQLLEQIERMRFESAHQLAALSAQEEANGSVREKNACIESVH